MPANPSIPGIQSVTAYALLQSFEDEKSVEVTEPLLDYSGGFVSVRAHSPTRKFSLRGAGDLPVALALGVDASGNMYSSGKTIVERVRRSQGNTRWPDWEASGTNYPNAA
jgi:hypothetical protein